MALKFRNCEILKDSELALAVGGAGEGRIYNPYTGQRCTEYRATADETFGGIAGKHGVSLNLLRSQNPQIEDPEHLSDGELFYIPAWYSFG